MSRVPIREVVLDPAGNVQVNIPVTVRTVPQGAIATIYAAETGAPTLSNPVSTDAAGRVPGWVDEGAYDLTVGSDPTVIRLNLIDPERNTGLTGLLVSQVFG